MLNEQARAHLDALINDNPNIKAQRERTGTIWISEDLNNGKEHVMTVHPLWENSEQLEPAVAIEVRTMDKDHKTRKYSTDRPEIRIRPGKEGMVTVSVDETYGKWDSDLDLQDLLKKTRIGLSMLEAVGGLPEEEARMYAGRIFDGMASRSEIINYMQQGAPIFASTTKQIDEEAPHRVPRKEFISYAVKILGKPQDITESLPEAVLKARSAYNQTPEFHSSILSNPVYQKARPLFERKVNNWDLADGQGFIQTVGDTGLKIEDVSFTNWGERDSEMGAATPLEPSAYIFDSKRNAIVVLDQQGKVHEIKVNQFGVVNPKGPQEGNSLRVRIPSGVEKNEISVEFSLVDKADDSILQPGDVIRDTDRLEVVTETPQSENTKLSGAMQRHADYYLNMLMILDPVADEKQLDLEMDQIYAAERRLSGEEVGSIFHPGMIEMKLKTAAGGFVERLLTKLVQDNIQNAQELSQAEIAYDLISSGKINYPINVKFLKQKIDQTRKKLLVG